MVMTSVSVWLYNSFVHILISWVQYFPLSMLTWQFFLQPNVFFQPFNKISSLPYSILVVLYPMPPNNDIPGLHMLFYILFILAAVVNQVIYVFSNSFYKKAFQEAFKKDFIPKNPFEKRSYVFHIDRSTIVQ